MLKGSFSVCVCPRPHDAPCRQRHSWGSGDRDCWIESIRAHCTVCTPTVALTSRAFITYIVTIAADATKPWQLLLTSDLWPVCLTALASASYSHLLPSIFIIFIIIITNSQQQTEQTALTIWPTHPQCTLTSDQWCGSRLGSEVRVSYRSVIPVLTP